MVHLNYEKPDVLVMYHGNDGQINPTADQIEAFDAHLFADNDEDLKDIMGEPEFNAMDKSPATRSRVLLYSRSGPGDLRDRIRGGCRFFMNTQNL